MYRSLIATDDANSPGNETGAALAAWLARYRRVFVLTGAGISTNSGIPDYRGADGGWKGRSPMTYQDFVGDPAKRARYWARSFVGWPSVAGALPNQAHGALVRLEAEGRLSALVTQNVDGRHSQRGSDAGFPTRRAFSDFPAGRLARKRSTAVVDPRPACRR